MFSLFLSILHAEMNTEFIEIESFTSEKLVYQLAKNTKRMSLAVTMQT